MGVPRAPSAARRPPSTVTVRPARDFPAPPHDSRRPTCDERRDRIAEPRRGGHGTGCARRPLAEHHRPGDRRAPRAATPVRRRAVRHLPARPRVRHSGAGRRGAARVLGRQGRIPRRPVLAQEGARPEARRLPRRRVRRRQDAPPRVALARHAGTEVLRHLHRVHGARRGSRLPGRRRHPPRSDARGHRRVRARRPGRHDDDDAPAVRPRGRRHAHRRDEQHAAERPGGGALRGGRLPPRDPGHERPVRHHPHRRPRLPAPRLRRPRGHRRRRRPRRTGRCRAGRRPGRDRRRLPRAGRAPLAAAPLEVREGHRGRRRHRAPAT